jgi:hypothetical protein
MFKVRRESSFQRTVCGHLAQIVITQRIWTAIEQLGEFTERKELIAAKLKNNPPDFIRARSLG